MSTIIYPMRLSREESALFRSAAKRKGVSLAEYLRTAGRAVARNMETEPASLALSRAGFTLPDRPGSERDQIRAAIAKRHVSR